MESAKKKAGWKQKFVHELREYWVNFLYLAFFFIVFASYRRLILAHYEISYDDYGVGLIKALILAKVIMIGNILGLGRRLEDKPLIYPTLYKTFVFILWVALFTFIEAAIRGLLHGKGLMGGLSELVIGRRHESLADTLVLFVAFIPFFAFKELERLQGRGKIFDLFFRSSGRSANFLKNQ